jgi:hypothetical protein
MKSLAARMGRGAVFVFLLVLCILPCYGEEILVTAFDYYLDMPEGWRASDITDPALISFIDPQRKAVFQVTVFQGERFESAGEVAAFYREQIGARGEEAAFSYQGADAVIADYTFQPGSGRARGWFVFVSGGGYHFVLSAFCGDSVFDDYNDVLLSCIDSFAPGGESRLYPGAVSQFYQNFPPPRDGSAALAFNGERFTLATSKGEAEANTVVIDREARILAAAEKTGGDLNAAWKRFYRVIFRDSYMRLLPLTRALKPLLEKSVKSGDFPAAVLSWFQGFSYSRTATLSDFQSPVDCVLGSSGDCDSLGMAYIIILRQLGFDAILLVSEKYSHALAAVDVPGEGARFDFGGKRYLVAELTRKVALGRISREMANAAFWLPVALGHQVEEEARSNIRL